VKTKRWMNLTDHPPESRRLFVAGSVNSQSNTLDEARFLPVPALLRDFALIGESVAVAATESSDGSRALRCGFWAGVATQRTTTRRFLRR
jgi:hypothetical protein